jgi:hypothetical protein
MVDSVPRDAAHGPKRSVFRDPADERSRLRIRVTRLVSGIAWFVPGWTAKRPARKVKLAYGRFARRLDTSGLEKNKALPGVLPV